jgi:hypothetical protein
MAAANELPDAIITESGLKITPLDAAVPDTAQALIDQTAMILPHVKITELLMEVDEWTGFTRHFTHLKSGDLGQRQKPAADHDPGRRDQPGPDQDGRVLPRHDLRQAGWLQAWHIRDETYSAALAELVNAQFRHPFAGHWGDGTTSSSDGQNFRTGSKAESTGHINPKYGSSPGGRSTPTSPTSTRRSTPRWSTSACAIRPTCSTACCTTSPTCASRNTTPTRRASPITSLP